MKDTPNTTTSERVFFSLTEAADQIGCTRRFLEKRIDDGEIARFAPSKRLIRIKRTELERWIESYTARKGGVVA